MFPGIEIHILMIRQPGDLLSSSWEFLFWWDGIFISKWAPVSPIQPLWLCPSFEWWFVKINAILWGRKGKHAAVFWRSFRSAGHCLAVQSKVILWNTQPYNKRPVGLYSSAAYWNHDDQGKGSSSELDMSDYIMFGLDWVCLTTTRPSGHISRRINNVWPILRHWSFSWSFQDVCLAVLYVRKGQVQHDFTIVNKI